MKADDYQVAVLRTGPPELSRKDTVTNCIFGITGESGELAEIFKKYYFHGHPLDITAVMKEMGDILWYIALLADELEMPLSEVMAGNIAKLQARYPEGFSIERSVNRDE